MTSLLSPVSPVGALSRDTPAPSVTQGAPRPAAPLESARAPRPVDPAGRAERLRAQTARDRPVGPPPSFEVNVLQDIRERLADPAGPQPAAQGDDPGATSPGPQGSVPDDLDTPAMPALAPGLLPHHLDKKV